MKRLIALFFGAALAAAPTAQAQTSNPMSEHLKGQWTNVRDLLTKMADAMPDDAYRFKPTPEMQDFGQRMAHVLTFNMRGCSAAKGEQKAVTISATPTKADIQAAIKEVNAQCDGVFNALTDADAMTLIAAGRGGQRPKLAILEGTVLEHSQEVYGYLCPYLRLKGIVPPSSNRNER
jgi:DinB family protein